MNRFIQILYKIRYGKPSSHPIYLSIRVVFNNEFKGRVFINKYNIFCPQDFFLNVFPTF
jgi:hypothetical protein